MGDAVITLHPELAFEYLDDGGVLICQLERGDYWQLSGPAGRIWAWIWESCDFDFVAEAMTRELTEDRRAAVVSLTELCVELRALGVVVDFLRSHEAGAN